MPKKKDDLSALIDKYIQTENLEDIVGDRFGRYSKYIIQDRALPDVRDGLKPVQRRILFALHKLLMTPDKPYKKSARIVGDVIGKYHPHGDQSVYDAMVRMAQDFKYHIPLIDMHGNKGSVDGDPAAAMRYTEARMAKASQYLLEDIDQKTVAFVPNFDDEEYEPVVLPAKFLNLLINGASGISAGYATDIPPHNIHEVTMGVIHRMKHPASSLEDIMKYIKGPDFPTGGIVQGLEGIKEAFETGRGRVIIKAAHEFEGHSIVFTELPYDVNKAMLVRKIDELRLSKKVDGIKEVRDESDKDGVRVCVDVKKEFDLNAVLNFLQKKTDLVKSFNYNMVAIHDQRPMLMGLLDILDAYITHQKEVFTNRSNHQLRNAKKRLHIVEGIIHMTDVVDEVIRLIRASKDKASAKKALVSELDFSEEQAEAILILQLYKLSNTDVKALEDEAQKLRDTIDLLKDILSNEEALETLIEKELKAMMKQLEVKRRSLIEETIDKIVVSEEALIKSEQMMLGLTKEGYLRVSSLRSYNATDEISFKENDGFILEKEVSTLDTLLIFYSSGEYLYVPVYKIPENKWKDIGIHLNSYYGLEINGEIINAHVISNFEAHLELVLTTQNNLIKRTLLNEFVATRYHRPLKAIGLNKKDQLVDVALRDSTSQEVISFTQNGLGLRYDIEEIPLTGITAKGVKAMNLSAKDALVRSVPLKDHHDLLVLTSRGSIKRLDIEEIPKKKRTLTPVAIYKNTKTNPYYLVDAMLLSGEIYKNHIQIAILSTKTTILEDAFEIKKHVAEVGKTILSKKEGTALSMRYLPHHELEASTLSDFKQKPLEIVQQQLFEEDSNETDA